MQTPEKKPTNLWPVSIIAFFTIAVCGVVSYVIFCTRQHVDLVTADYYEQEVRYQDHLDRVNRAASLQAPAQIGYDTATKLITVALPADHLNQPLKGWIQLYRPSSATMDQKLNLQVDAAGHQVISAAHLSDGLWHVRVSWTMNGADYYYDQKVVVGAKQKQT